MITSSKMADNMCDAEAIEGLRKEAFRLRAENERLKANKRTFPIQDGPSIPWSVMAPHEGQCRRNHGQSLERLAERGGLGCSEAWLIVNDKKLGFAKDDHARWKAKWIEYAEKVNGLQSQCDRYKAALDAIATKASNLYITLSALGADKLVLEKTVLKQMEEIIRKAKQVET